MRSELVPVVVILLINLAVSVIYLAAGLTVQIDKKKVLVYFFLMILLPVFFPVFMLLTLLFEGIARLLRLDLSDVVFGKEKITALDRGDFEAENNLVPIEEALVVTDQASLRTFMLNILKGDVTDSLSKLKGALESGDSETAHYAATVLREEMNKFRTTVYSSFASIRNTSGEERTKTCLVTIRYISEYLTQDIFAPDEQTEYASRLADLGDIVFEDDYRKLTVEDYYNISMRLLKVKDYDRCRQWCVRLEDIFPDEQESYLAKISFYFETGRRKEFRAKLKALMDSGIPVDDETMRHIRAFR